MRSVAEILKSYGVVNEQGVHINGTDKMTNHSYGDAYDALFTYPETEKRFACSSREDIKLMMEVGVADGSCLLAWREVFPNAQIVGMDIHHSDKAHGERLEFHFGNQCCKDDCEKAADGRLFDVIIEDATHHLEKTLLTLFYLWPFVKRGGLYIVEEWDNIGALRSNIKALFPNAEIVDTAGPFGGVEPLVVFRKT